MKNLFFITITFFSTLLFSYIDSDFDGVPDADDRCPNTPFTELVDINGCSVKSLVPLHHFDMIVGVSYSDSDYQTLNRTDTLSSTLQVDYYYKNFSFEASTSYFSTHGDDYSDTGFNDSFLGASYQLSLTDSLLLRAGVGVSLPNYETSLNNNKTDYLGSLNLSYSANKINIFAGLSYTLINDTDTVIVYEDNTTQDVNYQDTIALSAGLGYYVSDKVYVSSAYNFSNSIYKDVEDLKSLSFYGYYEISKKYFSTLSYAYGISDSASKNYLSIRFGYLF